MLLYHPKATAPVDCHPTQIEHMKSKGWTEDLKKMKKPADEKEPKTKTKSAT